MLCHFLKMRARLSEPHNAPTGRDWSQSDAHEYTTALEAKLAGIEGENIRAIIASDRQVPVREFIN